MLRRKNRALYGRLPCAFGGVRISGAQIRPRNLQIQNRLAERFVFRMEKRERFGFVSGFQTGLFSGDSVLGVVFAVGPPIENKPLFHTLPFLQVM